jgi:C-terminal processing protease CtpA/Prc
MSEVILGIICIALLVADVFLIVLNKSNSKGYDQRVQDLQKQTNILSAQLVKLALSKNVAEYAQAEAISSIVDPVTNDMDSDNINIESMNDRDFSKFLKKQLNPEEETEE